MTPPSRVEGTHERFPARGSTGLEHSGHLPFLDEPAEAVRLILDSTG